MRAALQTLAEYPVQGKRIALLGDMFELGSIAQEAHREIGCLAAACKVDVLLTVGQAMELAHREAAAQGVQAVHCANKEQALHSLLQCVRSGDAVLVKASHGMALETVLASFYAAYPPQ
jgi:UDP-N-acetylmuramoyl-tripeptide--D-alanyl-D-alanine ligase